MRDARKFEALLDRVLCGESPAAAEWEPFRDEMAVLITDLSGFTRLMRELGTGRMSALLLGMRRISLPLLAAHGGVLVKYQADDLFAAFRSPADALRCAVGLLRDFERPEPPLPAEVRLCMGIGFGSILWWGENDLYGEDVNLASKLGEDTAGPGEILLTAPAAVAARASLPAARLTARPPIEVGGRRYEYFRYDGGL